MFKDKFREKYANRGDGSFWGCHRGDEKHFRGRHGLLGDVFGARAEQFGAGFRARFFDNGDLRFVILQLIAEKPRYGYDLIKAIEEMVSGAYTPSPGVVYPTLTLLEELGYTTVSASDGNKKLYAITDEGRAALEQNKATVDALFARMESAGKSHGHHRSPRILRAIQNLKFTLKLKAGRTPLTEEQIQKIAAALDAAAQQIEQI
jgi:DNA-binding PadR family transcriptional regulator